MSSADSFGLGECAIARIHAVLASYPQVEAAIIYGSRAKGNYRDGSDIDLALRGEQLTEIQLCALENELDALLLPWQMDVCRLTDIQNPALMAHIQRVGQPFYSRPTFPFS